MRPPRPKLPPSEISFRWFARPLQLLEDCRYELGDVFELEFAHGERHTIITRPEHVREVFLASNDVVLAGEGNRLLRPILGPGSLLVTDGERHEDDRGRTQALFGRDLANTVRRLAVDAVARRTAEWTAGAVISTFTTALAVSRDVILQTVLGASIGEIACIEPILREMMSLVGANAPLDERVSGVSLEQRFRSVRARLDAVLQPMLIEARTGKRRGMIASFCDQDPAITDTDRIDQLITLILAGHETTASAIAWGLILLSRNSPLQQASGSRDMPGWTERVSLETLRLYPVVPIVSRRLTRDLQIGAWTLEAGTFVSPSPYLTHRDPDTFSNPLEFRPDRFLGHRYSAFEYYPFGGGIRRCVGMAFALAEMESVLRNLTDRFHFQPADPIHPVRRAVTIVPSGNGKLRLERRDV